MRPLCVQNEVKAENCGLFSTNDEFIIVICPGSGEYILQFFLIVCLGFIAEFRARIAATAIGISRKSV
jgi:hypothetical protein